MGSLCLCVSAAFAARVSRCKWSTCVCSWLRLPWILPFLVCTNAPCAQHDIVFPTVSHADVVESECFPMGVPFDAVVIAASNAESKISSGREAVPVETKRQLIQPLLTEHRWYRFNVGTCELVWSLRHLLLSEHRRLRRFARR